MNLHDNWGFNLRESTVLPDKAFTQSLWILFGFSISKFKIYVTNDEKFPICHLDQGQFI